MDSLYLTYQTEIASYSAGNSGTISIPLIEGGAEIFVTDENKEEFITKCWNFRLIENVKAQLDAIIRGFRAVIPKKVISIFRLAEFKLLLSGLHKIELDELISSIKVEDSKDYKAHFLWFCEMLKEYSEERLNLFLQFATGLFNNLIYC